MEKWEIDIIDHPGYYCESFIAMITGHELADILEAADGCTIWRGREWIRTIRALGFNCNTRFKKFDRETEYPCILRTKHPDDKKHWYPFIYSGGIVYHPHFDYPVKWETFNYNQTYKITSMLQVWI